MSDSSSGVCVCVLCVPSVSPDEESHSNRVGIGCRLCVVSERRGGGGKRDQRWPQRGGHLRH